jgi:FG-GAP repeat
MGRAGKERRGSLWASASVALLAFIGSTLIVGVEAPSAAAPSLSFARPTHYPTGKAPNSVGLGDLNGDGKPDLVTRGR